MTRRRAVTLVFVLAGAPLALTAQKPVVPAARCDRVDTTASWYRRQAEWWALDAKHDWSSDSVRNLLLHATRNVEPNGSGPFPLQLGASLGETPSAAGTIDSSEISTMRDMLREMVKKRSWPTRSLVGPAGVRAAWMVIRGDSALTSVGMHRMMESGPGEVSGFDVAVLEDWMRIENGRKQIYATQLRRSENGREGQRLIPAPTEDLAHVDLRRDAAALPPLSFALCSASKAVH